MNCLEPRNLPIVRALAPVLLLLVIVPAAPGHPSLSRSARAFAAAGKQGPLALEAFLRRMPKGGDLHVHLSGAIYAETWLRDAAADGLCVDPAALAFDHDRATAGVGTGCKPGEIAGAEVLKDQHLYDSLIDAFSMRTFVPVTGESGHDHFFATFDRFSGVDKKHRGEWIDEVATRAAAQNEQYLELMETPDFKPAVALATKIGYQQDLAKYRDEMVKAGVRDELPKIRVLLDRDEADRRAREHCGQPDAQPACSVAVRYIYQVARGLSPEADFAQILLGFEVASGDPRWVGLNLVRPEDGYGELHDYGTDMRILDALHALYPKVHISLHAGELAPGLVEPSELTFHIREAIAFGHAERIGHGVDVMHEDRPYDLLQEMAARHIMVEINLTSNDVILAVKGADHPLPFYLRAHVPVALSTDDEGVSRIDLTHEYVRAAVTYPLNYADLKQMARNSLTYSFLPGASLWDAPACKAQLGAAQATGTCADVLKASEKAQEQWELEHRLHTFEASF